MTVKQARKATKIVLPESTIIRRINRQLKKANFKLRVAHPHSRMARCADPSGKTYRYFVIDQNMGRLHDYTNDLAGLARKLTCLRAEEEVAS